MKRCLWAIFLMGIINSCTPACAQERDSVFLTTGQIMIGEVKGGSLGEITIDEMVFKTIDIKLYRIKRITTFRRFKIETLDKVIYYGVIKASEKEGWVTIILDHGDSVQTPVTEINTIIAFQKKFFQQLNGNISAASAILNPAILGRST